MRKRDDLRALRNMIEEARRILATTTLPEGRATRARELLTTAVALADELIATPPAAMLGRKGGLKTKQRGSEYFAKIAAMRKTKAGGRPPKEPA